VRVRHHHRPVGPAGFIGSSQSRPGALPRVYSYQDRGRRIPAQLVPELAATSAGREVLAVDYDDLEPEDVRDAERWWVAARGFEQAA
jgi:hypothetical protein